MLNFTAKDYKYGDLNLVLDKQISIKGVFLSSCTLENYDECISRVGTKSGPGFEICQWNYHLKTFKEVGRYPDCIKIDLLPLGRRYVSEKQLQEFKKYLNKEVNATGILKSVKVGAKGTNCEMTQIGCEREVIIFIPEKIEIVE
ncbi:MAG: hypothetical protein DRP03_00505 [Candidatus Aenigmatarchaeota archaeon]|nr:MAG: hypothetical protein DRP03_00505 [Candidatus Aenigmarchaeota archaeon]